MQRIWGSRRSQASLSDLNLTTSASLGPQRGHPPYATFPDLEFSELWLEPIQYFVQMIG